MIFNTTSKSDYVLFAKSRGFNNKPENMLLLNNNNDENFENKYILGDDKPENPIIDCYLPVSILLEDEIVESLKLNKIGLFKLKDDKVSRILKQLRPIKIGNKSAGVKAGFIKLWKAEFSLKNQEAPDGFRKTYSASFTSPHSLSIDEIEEHLYNFGTVKIENPQLTYKYVRGSARIMGGRKYKNES